jgi:hypothetical protein
VVGSQRWTREPGIDPRAVIHRSARHGTADGPIRPLD